MLVFNGLDPREYFNDIHSFLPWRLESRGRVQEVKIVESGSKLFSLPWVCFGKLTSFACSQTGEANQDY